MWTATENPTGTEGGVVVLDEEHPAGARITLERDCASAPFAITCGIYGLMVHTCFRSDEAEARRTYAAMKVGIEHILALPQDALPDAAEDFANRF